MDAVGSSTPDRHVARRFAAADAPAVEHVIATTLGRQPAAHV